MDICDDIIFRKWNILNVLYECQTNTKKPLFPLTLSLNENFGYSEYDIEQHGAIVELPLVARHYIVKELDCYSDLSLIQNSFKKFEPDDAETEKLILQEGIVFNFLSLLFQLRLCTMLEALLVRGIDVNQDDLILLDNWRFTYLKETSEDNPNKEKTDLPSEFSEGKTVH